jgi:peptidoglycan hydrolase-like protein with peptidoglycan-binding domain
MRLKVISFTVFVLVICFMLFPTAAFADTRSEVLMIGDKDDYVMELQEALSTKGYLKVNPTGYYGTLTQAAVMSFQRDKGLVIDGKAGPITRKSLFAEAYVPIGGVRDTPDEKTPEKYYLGDKGSEVEKIQTRLKELGYYEYPQITGYFGPITKKAVLRFQKTNKLTEDGVVGAASYAKLFSGTAKYFTLYPTDKGEDVVEIQTRLKELGYYDYSKITGYYGSITKAAVVGFQKANGLTHDGVVGRNTRKKMFSADAIKGEASNNEAPSKTDTQTKIDALIAFAKTQIGKPYILSTEGPSSFDCSGYVYYVLKNNGIAVSRYSAAVYSQQSQWTKINNIGALKKGDLMFFRSPSSASISHMGIYIGDGQIIHASSGKRQIMIANVSGYFTDNFTLARRVY